VCHVVSTRPCKMRIHTQILAHAFRFLFPFRSLSSKEMLQLCVHACTMCTCYAITCLGCAHDFTRSLTHSLSLSLSLLHTHTHPPSLTTFISRSLSLTLTLFLSCSRSAVGNRCHSLAFSPSLHNASRPLRQVQKQSPEQKESLDPLHNEQRVSFGM